MVKKKRAPDDDLPVLRPAKRMFGGWVFEIDRSSLRSDDQPKEPSALRTIRKKPTEED